jgi:hypothetical protein
MHDTMNHNDDEFQVRWGDKHGGYGEHYWDYNHAGHVSLYFYLEQGSSNYSRNTQKAGTAVTL